MKACETCEYRYWQEGIKITAANDNIPASCIGSFLPGDEPGYYCVLTEGLCDEVENEEDCPNND